jgi:hypothetical protein
MTHVILIEDRIYRQQNILGDKASNLNNYLFLKNISGGEEFTQIKNQILEKKYSVLDQFSTILFHRSAFDSDARNGIMNYFNNSQKKIVQFSGGISGSHITKVKHADLMMMNVSEFYSDKLFQFLDNNAENLLQLAFGNNWPISILINAIEKLTIYEKTYSEEIPYSVVESNLEFPQDITDKYFGKFESNIRITKSQLDGILKSMNADLKELL